MCDWMFKAENEQRKKDAVLDDEADIDFVTLVPDYVWNI